MRARYDFSCGVRGKYYKRYLADSNVVVLEPDVHKHFRNSAAVNKALRALIRTEQRTPAKRSLRMRAKASRPRVR